MKLYMNYNVINLGDIYIKIMYTVIEFVTVILNITRLTLFIIAASPFMIHDLVNYWRNPNVITVPYDDTFLLDIYCPTLHQTKPSHTSLKPVIVYFVGGSWMFTTRRYGLVLGKIIDTSDASLDALLVVPDVGNGPFVNIASMIETVKRSIEWVVNNIDQYGGDVSRITLLGHSSGAFIVHRAISIMDPTLLQSISAFVGIGGPYCLTALNATIRNWGLGMLRLYKTPQPSMMYSYLFGEINVAMTPVPFNNINYFIIHNNHDRTATMVHVNFIQAELKYNRHCVIPFDTNHCQLVVEDLLFNKKRFTNLLLNIAYNSNDVYYELSTNGQMVYRKIHHDKTMVERESLTMWYTIVSFIGNVVQQTFTSMWYRLLIFINPM